MFPLLLALTTSTEPMSWPAAIAYIAPWAAFAVMIWSMHKYK